MTITMIDHNRARPYCQLWEFGLNKARNDRDLF